MRKGLELPINTLVVITMVIIVLLAIAFLFVSIWGGGTSAFALESARRSACSKLQSFDCGEGFLSAIHFNADVNIGADGKTDGVVDEKDTLLAYCTNFRCKDRADINNCCVVEACQCTKKIPEYGTPLTTTAPPTATTPVPGTTTAVATPKKAKDIACTSNDECQSGTCSAGKCT